MENWISPDELRRIADIASSCDALWEALITTKHVGVNCDEFSFTVYDSNGSRLGYIRWADSGAAFYPDMSDE